MEENSSPKKDPVAEWLSQWIADNRDAITRAVADVATISNNVVRDINAMAEMQRQVGEEIKRARVVREQFIEKIGQGLEWFRQIAESQKALPARTRKALSTLGENGWFLDAELPFSAIWRLSDAFETGESADADEALADYFRARTAKIEQRITQRFPKRARIVREAFGAYENKQYALAIPVFLAQVDGVCQDLTGIQFYGKNRDGKRKTAAYVESFPTESLISAFLHHLAEPLPICAGKDHTNYGKGGLNRHEVLHGVSLDYDTEINCLKVISLLNYLVQTIKTEDRGN